MDGPVDPRRRGPPFCRGPQIVARGSRARRRSTDGLIRLDARGPFRARFEGRRAEWPQMRRRCPAGGVVARPPPRHSQGSQTGHGASYESVVAPHGTRSMFRAMCGSAANEPESDLKR